MQKINRSILEATSRKWIARLSLFVTTCLVVLASPLHADEPSTWRAGVAKVKITPPEPVWMAGYAARTKPADATLSDLWAKALALQDGEGRLVLLITLDVCGVDRQTSQAMRDQLQKAHKLDPANIAICVSHTHSGPVVGENLRPTYGLTGDEQAKVAKYTLWLQERVAEAASAAIKAMTPVSVTYGVGTADIAVNRRQNKEADVAKLAAADTDKTLSWRKNLNGPTDHDLPVLAIRAGDKPIAILFGYGCHATTLSDNAWSADWPGYACEAIEKRQPGVTALFVAGCGADQNPLPRRTVPHAQQYGQEAAAGVQQALGGKMQPITGALAADYREINLPLAQLPSKEQLEHQRKSADPKDRYLARRASLLLERLARDGKLAATYPYPLQTWRMGTTGPTLVLMGGEVVVDYALRLKKEAGGNERIWPIAYANDVMAYIPSRRVLNEGGYEGATSMVFYAMPSTWSAESEDLIVAEIHRQLRANPR